MDAAGYDPIIVETSARPVGGRGHAAVQTVLVVCAPGMATRSAIKAGILEIADLFVVSKADRPGSDQTVAELAMLLSLDPAAVRLESPAGKCPSSKPPPQTRGFPALATPSQSIGPGFSKVTS